MKYLSAVFYPREFTGWHMVGVMGLFFGTIISVNLWLAYSAGSTWTGLVVKNTYVESQKFNQRTEKLKEQLALGWRAKFTYQEGFIAVDLVQGKSAAKPAEVVVKIGRPVQEGEDRVLILDQTGVDQYSKNVVLSAGLWEAHIRVLDSEGAEQFAQGIRFTVKP